MAPACEDPSPPIASQLNAARAAPAHHELLDVHAAAELLNVPSSWIAAQARADRIPHVRLGRYVRYEPDELRAWWRERAHGPLRTR